MVNPHGRVAIGFDVGTSSVKATALIEDGGVKVATSTGYPLSTPFSGAAEQDPEHWWSAVLEAGTALLDELERSDIQVGPENTVIGLTGQMHSSVLLGADWQVVHPAILWSDKRATAECDTLLDQVPDFEGITGNIPMPALTITHLMWLRTHKPEVFESVKWVANPKDEIRRRLGAGFFTEPADASGTGLFDTHTGDWSATIAAQASISLEMMPPVARSLDVTGYVTPGFDDKSSALLNRLAGIPVVGGGGDQATQAVALGVTAPGTLGLSLGTSGVAFRASDTPQPGSFRHAYDGQWLALDSTHAAGLSLTWLAQILDVNVDTAAASVTGPESAPTFLPYIAGHRKAGAEPGAPGSFIGLDTRHTRGDLVYAVMEGVAIELYRLARSVSSPGDLTTSDSKVHLGGGGGRSTTWLQLIADVFDIPVSYVDRDSSFGAAALGAQSVGWYENFTASDSRRPSVTSPREENRSLVRFRMDAFETYMQRLGG